MNEVDKHLALAMFEIVSLSNIAKANGDLPTMYAANRVLHKLFDMRKALDALANGSRETP
jgi:hypothetical protein